MSWIAIYSKPLKMQDLIQWVVSDKILKVQKDKHDENLNKIQHITSYKITQVIMEEILRESRS